MDFKIQNDNARDFCKQDFSIINNFLNEVRNALMQKSSLECDFLALEKFIGFIPSKTFINISLFQSNTKMIRFGSKRATLKTATERIVEMLKQNKNFANFEIDNPEKCRIMLEY